MVLRVFLTTLIQVYLVLWELIWFHSSCLFIRISIIFKKVSSSLHNKNSKRRTKILSYRLNKVESTGNYSQ